MAWHDIIMVGGGLMLTPDRAAGRCVALKREVASAQPQVELRRSGRSFVKGLLTNLANPKAIIDFGSVLFAVVGDSVAPRAPGPFLPMIVQTLAWLRPGTQPGSPCRGRAAAISGWRSRSTVSPVRRLRSSAST